MILDTNALSAVADGDVAIERILAKAPEVAVPAIVLGEFRYGIQQSRERERYEEWLTESIPNYRVIDVDQETALFYARLRSELRRTGTPIPANDAWIAALCRQHSSPLLSRDRHFDLVRGLRRNEW